MGNNDKFRCLHTVLHVNTALILVHKYNTCTGKTYQCLHVVCVYTQHMQFMKTTPEQAFLHIHNKYIIKQASW